MIFVSFGTHYCGFQMTQNRKKKIYSHKIQNRYSRFGMKHMKVHLPCDFQHFTQICQKKKFVSHGHQNFGVLHD